MARAGAAGSTGFDWLGKDVDNVRYEWFGHSDALNRQHIENYWLPVLRQPPSPLALLHGRNIHDRDQFMGILEHTGNVIDGQAYGNLPHYDEVEIPRGLSFTWIAINPDIYTFLMDRTTRTPAGYINAMPVDDSLYEEIRNGKIYDNQVSADHIVPYMENGAIKLYLMSIAIEEKYRRWGDGIFQQAYMQLLNGFLDKLIYYAKNHRIRVTRLLATSWTPAGRKMCEYFKMKEVGKDKFSDSILELDLEALFLSQSTREVTSPVKRLLKIYRQLQD